MQQLPAKSNDVLEFYFPNAGLLNQSKHCGLFKTSNLFATAWALFVISIRDARGMLCCTPGKHWSSAALEAAKFSRTNVAQPE
jgi:hypothetical protein